MDHHSLQDLTKYIRQVIALNFADSVWIHAEISQINSSRGQVYLDLIEQEKDSKKIIAKMQAVVMYRSVLFIKKKVGKLWEEIMQTGNEILIKIKIDYNEIYGLKLWVEDVDPSYTFGKAELKRKEIIERIEKEGLIHLNDQIPLPVIIQKIAIISSSTAAGYQDFLKQLEENPYQYKFKTTLFNSVVQGLKVESEMTQQLQEIRALHLNFDVIIIIRGGGSKFDLSAFDNYAISKAVAQMNLPVLTGIGHDIDSSVVDMVSHTALKTPTAVADFIIENNTIFEGQLQFYSDQIQKGTMTRISFASLRLNQIEQSVQYKSKNLISNLMTLLSTKWMNLQQITKHRFQMESQKIELLKTSIQSVDPRLTLKRGYAILRKEGKIIQNVDQITPNDYLEAEIQDGIIKTKVIDEHER